MSSLLKSTKNIVKRVESIDELNDYIGVLEKQNLLQTENIVIEFLLHIKRDLYRMVIENIPLEYQMRDTCDNVFVRLKEMRILELQHRFPNLRVEFVSVETKT